MGQLTFTVYDNTFNFTASVVMNVPDAALSNIQSWITATAPNNYNVTGANSTVYWTEYLWQMTQNAVFAYQANVAASQVAFLPAANLVTITVNGVAQNIASWSPLP